MPSPLLQFAGSHEKVFTALTAVATVVALFFTGWQVRSATKSLEASTVYNLQKDGRDLHVNLSKDHGEAYRVVRGLGGAEKVRPEEVELVATELIQYFSSVVNQHRNGVLGDDYWPAFDKEMCGLLRQPAVTTFWKQRVERGSYSEDFKRWGNSCLASI